MFLNTNGMYLSLDGYVRQSRSFCVHKDKLSVYNDKTVTRKSLPEFSFMVTYHTCCLLYGHIRITRTVAYYNTFFPSKINVTDQIARYPETS